MEEAKHKWLEARGSCWVDRAKVKQREGQRWLIGAQPVCDIRPRHCLGQWMEGERGLRTVPGVHELPMAMKMQAAMCEK